MLFAKAVELEYWKYEKIIFISDSAIWLKNMITELFPKAIQILDKFHLIESIYQYGNYVLNEERLKQAGMRWSADGANYLLILRCFYESGHWNEIEKIVTDYL